MLVLVEIEVGEADLLPRVDENRARTIVLVQMDLVRHVLKEGTQPYLTILSMSMGWLAQSLRLSENSCVVYWRASSIHLSGINTPIPDYGPALPRGQRCDGRAGQALASTRTTEICRLPQMRMAGERIPAGAMHPLSS